MLVLPHNCQCAANFQIGNDEAGRFSHKYASKMESGDKNVTLNLWTRERLPDMNVFWSVYYMLSKLIGSRFRVPGSRVTTYWHYLQLQPNAGLSLFHPLGENYLPPLWRRNSFGLSLLGFINPEPWTLNRSTQVFINVIANTSLLSINSVKQSLAQTWHGKMRWCKVRHS